MKKEALYFADTKNKGTGGITMTEKASKKQATIKPITQLKELGINRRIDRINVRSFLPEIPTGIGIMGIHTNGLRTIDQVCGNIVSHVGDYDMGIFILMKLNGKYDIYLYSPILDNITIQCFRDQTKEKVKGALHARQGITRRKVGFGVTTPEDNIVIDVGRIKKDTHRLSYTDNLKDYESIELLYI